MSRNGSGSYSLPEAPFVFDTVISETAMNNNLSDIGAALTASIAKDGQTTPTADLPMGTYKHTGVTTGSGANSAEYVARDYWLTQRQMANVVINPSGEVNQRGTTSTADDTYGGPDRWYSLNQTNATSWAQGTNLENGTPFYQRGTQSQAVAQRFGRAQIIESAACRHMRGQAIVLSARAQLSSTATLRYAILEWTGTADSVTSDVVNNWTSSTYTAGNFFVSTTTNVLAVGSVALTAATPATITELDATCGSSMNNLIIVFWTEATAAQNVTLDLAKASLKLGSDATPYYPPDIQSETVKCRRYYRRYGGAGNPVLAVGYAYSTTDAEFAMLFDITMRNSPTITFSGNGDFIVRNSNAGSLDTTAMASVILTAQSALINATVASGLTHSQGTVLIADSTPGTISFDVEL